MRKIMKLVLVIAILGLAACADQEYVYHPGQAGATSSANANSKEYYEIPSVVNDKIQDEKPSVQPPTVSK